MRQPHEDSPGADEALDAEILKEYEGGMFKGGKNKYTRALLALRHMPEYKAFDWRVQFQRNMTRYKRCGPRRRLPTCSKP